MRVSRLVLRTFTFVLFGALALESAAAAQTPPLVFTIPGTVNAGGLNNTRFVSDLAVTNPGSVPAQATISFIPVNGTTPKQVTLSAGETVVYRNVLDRLWGAQGAGATQVASDSPLLIRARTYNTAVSGTYGVALPVFANDRLLAHGKTAHSLWISQSADGSSGYRTNVAVVFPDAGGGGATVTVYDADGKEVGSQDYSLDAAGFQQFGVGGFAGAVSVARAEIQVTRGRAAGYSVVVDNVTGDSSLFSFEEAPSGYQDVVVNGVARANGRNNTFFRTDGRFFNPTDEDAVVKVSFHASGASNPQPVSRTFTVGAGRILDVVDVLGSLLGLPVGSAGAVRFETDASVGILCRTSNVDPAGVNPGTFGAQQKPTSLLSFLMSADAGAVVTGIRQNATFRTNVGFAAGGDGAAYTLTLKSASGATVATATGSLGAFGWTQPNVQDLFPNATIPDDATLQVKVTSGSVDVFDSSIDNASGDPVVTPIMPLPASIPSSATIGPEGGSVRSDDGRMTLKVPAGAFASPVTVALTPEAAGHADALGSAYALTPSPLPLGKPALLVFMAAGGPAPALGLVAVSLALKTDSGMFVATGGRVDPAAGTLSVPISSTSPSLVAGEAAVRGALAGGGIALLALENMVLFPENPTTLTDGSVMMQIYFRGPPTAGSESPIYDPYGDPRVTVSWTRPNVGSLDTTTGSIVTYTAPHRITRGMVWTAIKAKIRAKGIRIDLLDKVFIVRRAWNIESEMRLKTGCMGIWELAFSWWALDSFDIADNGKITKSPYVSTSVVIDKPKWEICNLIPNGYTTITPTGEPKVDVPFEPGVGAPYFDFKERKIVISGQSVWNAGGAVLTGDCCSPFVVNEWKGGYSYGFKADAGLEEGKWFDAFPLIPGTLHRQRIKSLDVP